MKATVALACAALVGVVASAAGQPPRNPSVCASRRLLPVDEAVTQPEFFTFRARLQSAIARRDEAAVLAAADPGIRTSFGPDDGFDAFRAALREPAGAAWAELGAVLALGGAFRSPGSFEAPYVFARWPDGLDSFECAAVIGDRVRLRASAAADSAVVGSASFDIVQVLPEQRATTAVRVRTGSGVTGFIAAPFVRSPVDHRAIFQRVAGQWRLAAFVAGD